MKKKQSDILLPVPKYAVFDIGNSRIKIIAGNNSSALEYKRGWKSGLIQFLRENTASFFASMYCSVNEKIAALLAEELELKFGSKPVKAIDWIKRKGLIHYSHIKGIGEDRIVGLAAACYFTEAPLITIDCGTAITINVLDEDNKCLGGTIFAGIDTQVKSLKEEASNLSKIKLVKLRKTAGENTNEAISAGVLLSAAGGIKEITSRIISENFPKRKVNIIITGGSSPLLKEYLAALLPKPLYIDNLAAKGMMKMLADQS